MKETWAETLQRRYPVRRSKKQKEAFFQYVSAVCHSEGYPCRIEENKKGCRNIVAGDPKKAKILFTAHYDTCAELPWPNLVFPLSQGMTLLAQMPLILLYVLITFCVAFGVGRLAGRSIGSAVGMCVYWALFLMIFYGPANPHTANDNTSGVAALLEIMHALPPDRRRDVAFLFFDLEEMGKVGSKAYAKAHPGITQGKVLLNLDCVGNGDHFLVIAPKKADESLKRLLEDAYQSRDGKEAIHVSAGKARYNSDQRSFENGAAVAACCKNRLGYHVPRIHTRRDVICRQENLEYVRDGALKLAENVLKFKGGTSV